MDWKTLFFGFDGRIGRRQWWLATIVLVSMSVGLSMLVNPMAWFGHGISRPNTADTLLSLSFLIPETAVNIKRFNDRGWPQFLPYGFSLAMVVFVLLDHFGRLSVEDSALAEHFVLAFMALVLVVVFDLGFLRGSRGPNRFGPDPLEQSPTESLARK